MSPLSKGDIGLGCSRFNPISLAWLGTRTVNIIVVASIAQGLNLVIGRLLPRKALSLLVGW